VSKKHLPKQSRNTKSGKISQEATANVSQGGSTDHQNPSFRFAYADENRWRLSDWQPDEILDLVRNLKKIEKHTWSQIKGQGSRHRGDTVGCGYKIINNLPSLPEGVSEDHKISEMRICQRKRIFGFRMNSIYYIVWFDRDHSICPE
jgi:hypothetical protein